jgi:tRNA dimethylallyltransferase
MNIQLNKKPLIIVSGATATGKTSTSLSIAKQFPSIEIVNFDSLLFFKELNIGTAKPTQQEMGSIPHHLLNIMSIADSMNASEFCKKALTIIENIHSRSKVPLLVGGSAFYIRALIKGMYEGPEISREAKDQVKNYFEQEGLPGLRAKLKEVDPTSYSNIHANDEYRTTRALEFFFSTSTKLSEQKAKFDELDPYDFSINCHPSWDILHIYMAIEKEEHWKIMLRRTQRMLQDGLVSEVEEIVNGPNFGAYKPLQSIGYKETLTFLERLTTESPMSMKELEEKIYIATRRLAKSQKTFFKKISPKLTFHPLTDSKQILNECSRFLSSFS